MLLCFPCQFSGHSWGQVIAKEKHSELKRKMGWRTSGERLLCGEEVGVCSGKASSLNPFVFCYFIRCHQILEIGTSFNKKQEGLNKPASPIWIQYNQEYLNSHSWTTTTVTSHPIMVSRLLTLTLSSVLFPDYIRYTFLHISVPSILLFSWTCC